MHGDVFSCSTAKSDEQYFYARRIAANIAKVPELLSR